jgi:hypothetical protein
MSGVTCKLFVSVVRDITMWKEFHCCAGHGQEGVRKTLNRCRPEWPPSYTYLYGQIGIVTSCCKMAPQTIHTTLMDWQKHFHLHVVGNDGYAEHIL